jgi:hypothetical protein
MSEYLGTLQQFRFHVENSLDTLLPDHQKVQLSRAVDVFVKRPDRFRADIESDLVHQEFYYDGRSITLFGKKVNFYATLEAPGTFEEAMDYAIEAYGLFAPMHELLYKKCHEILTQDVTSGVYMGLSKIFDIECHHLAFRGTDVDWQIWIENSPTPVPRKMVITSKWLAGAPQFTAFVSDWKTTVQLPDSMFSFSAPKNAEMIEFIPAERSLRLQK